MEDLKQRTGIDMQHVPYRGAAPALNGILGNEVSVMLLNLSSVEEHAKAGKVQADRGSNGKARAALAGPADDRRDGARLPDIGLVRAVGAGENAACSACEDSRRRIQGA